MPFNLVDFSVGRGSYNNAIGGISPANHFYGSTTDLVSVMAADGYFNEAAAQLPDSLRIGDVIMIRDSTDAILNLKITALTPVFTVEAPLKFIAIEAAQVTTLGGGVTESFTVTGVLSTDILSLLIHTEGGASAQIVEAFTKTDGFDVKFTADPSTDSVLDYVIFRAV